MRVSGGGGRGRIDAKYLRQDGPVGMLNQCVGVGQTIESRIFGFRFRFLVGEVISLLFRTGKCQGWDVHPSLHAAKSVVDCVTAAEVG